MGFLEPAPGAANTHMACFLSFEERNSGACGGAGRPVTGVRSPGTQQPLWEQDSFPVSPGLKEFLGKLIFAGASVRGGAGVGVISGCELLTPLGC